MLIMHKSMNLMMQKFNKLRHKENYLGVLLKKEIPFTKTSLM